MDAMAAFGSLIITEGATAPGVVVELPEPPAGQSAAQCVAQPVAQPLRSAEELQAVNAVFTSQAADQNAAVPFFVITACASALKGVVIDESGRWNKEEEDAEADKTDNSSKNKPQA